MTDKRKSLPKKVRFEVLKRDKFTCQYCGATAPDAVLHIDHIEPVATGGSDEIVNLITACAGCNLGKGAVRLDDDAAVNKQRRHLEAMEDRRQQLQMMAEWRQEVADTRSEECRIAVTAFNANLTGKCLNEFGEQRMMKLLVRFSLTELLNAIDISVQYLTDDDKREDTYTASIERALDSLGGICYNRRYRPREGQ